MCHLILLLPFVGFAVFWLWPLELALPSYLAALLLSAWVYYHAVAALDWKVRVGAETLLHRRGELVPGQIASQGRALGRWGPPARGKMQRGAVGVHSRPMGASR